MLTALRKRVTYTNVALTLALVFAMTGGAYAANKYLITSTKQISPKVLASLKGKNGKNGAPGSQGPTGPAGAVGGAGMKGDTGAPGGEGPIGKEGPQGKQGIQGVKGTAGSPWTAGGTLPSNATETGVWSLGTIPASSAPTPTPNGVIVSVSFPVPLEKSLGEGHVHYINTKGEELELTENASFENEVKAVAQANPAPCPGTVESPKAEPGQFCAYEQKLFGAHLASQMIGNPAESTPPFNNELEGVGKSGAILNAFLFSPATDVVVGWGTWAVTAP